MGGFVDMMNRTRWFGLRMVGETTWAPDTDKFDERRRIAVDFHFDAVDHLEARGIVAFRSDRAPWTEDSACPRRRAPRRHCRLHRRRDRRRSRAVSDTCDSCDRLRRCGFRSRPSEGSALMRLMSAVPRDVSAKSRSSSTTSGRWRVITSSALSASASENMMVSTSSSRSLARQDVRQRQ